MNIEQGWYVFVQQFDREIEYIIYIIKITYKHTGLNILTYVCNYGLTYRVYLSIRILESPNRGDIIALACGTALMRHPKLLTC